MRSKVFVLFLIFAFCFSKSFAEEKYFVCVSSFSFEKNADALVSLLKKNDLPAFKVKAEVSGKVFFRVLTGNASETRNEAEKIKSLLQENNVFSELKINGSFWICKADSVLAEQIEDEKNESIETEIEIEKNETQSTDSETAETTESSAESIETESEETANEEISQKVLEKNADLPFSEEKRFSVFVNSYGEEQKAHRDEKRLFEEKNIESFVVKKYDKERLFSFDLYAGTFSSIEEAEEFQNQLSESGIKNTKIRDFNEIKDAVHQYEETVKNQKIVAADGIEKIPDSLSSSVRFCLSQFPADNDFDAESVYIYDLDSARKNAVDFYSPEIVTTLFPDENIFDLMNAFMFVKYKDDLFSKKIEIFIADCESKRFSDLTEKIAAFEASAESSATFAKQEFSLPYGKLKSVTVQENDSHLLVGSSDDGKLLLIINAEDFTKEEFDAFLQKTNSTGGFETYPQIKKTLFVMPDTDAEDLNFVGYSLAKVNESYAEYKSFAKWATAIVGHWEAESVYFFKGAKIKASFFDLDYDYNARFVHDIFMSEKVEGVCGHSLAVNEKNGWFVYGSQSNEFSFSQKSYIVALNTNNETSLLEEDFVNFASLLQIW